MKKMNFLKIALTFVLAMAISGAFAQATDVPGDGANFAANYETGGQAAVGETTYLMEGTTIPLFALPDTYFHPLYNNTTEVYTLNAAGFTWVWTEVTGTLTITQSAPADNYVTVGAAVGDAGTYTINVTETAPALWGGCDDGAGENIDVVVVAQPDITIGGDASYNLCEGDAGLPAAVTATISDGWQNFRAVWSLEIKTLNPDGTDKDLYDNDQVTVGGPLAESFTTASPDVSLVSGANDITPGLGFVVIDNSATVYTYTMTSVNCQASRYGQFIAKGGVEGTDDTFTYYKSTAAETVTIRVNPSPNTGPIYHINSAWSN
jgi:hypothetical protein